MFSKSWFTAILLMAIPVALLLVGYLVGMAVEGGEASKEKLALQTAHIEALAKAHADYKTKLKEDRKLNEEVIGEYLDEKDEIERKYRELSRAGGLRLPRSVCDSVPVPTGAAGEPGAAEADAATVVLPERTSENLRRVHREADEVTAQCRALIEQVSK